MSAALLHGGGRGGGGGSQCPGVSMVLLLAFVPSCAAVRDTTGGLADADGRGNQSAESDEEGSLLHELTATATLASFPDCPPCKKPKRLMLVRDGESVNDIVSQDLRKAVAFWKGQFDPYLAHGSVTRYREELRRLGALGWSSVLDSPLSAQGMHDMRAVGRMLFGDRRDEDPYGIFTKPRRLFQAVLVSPLRRAQGTAFEIFGLVAKAQGIPFVASPWAHEWRNSMSDVGEAASVLRDFAVAEGHKLGIEPHEEPLKSLLKSLEGLRENWATDTTCPDAAMPYYPKDTRSPLAYFKDPDCQEDTHFRRQLCRLEADVCARADDAGVILVTHGRVIKAVVGSEFIPEGRAPANGAFFVTTLPAEESEVVFGEDFLRQASNVTEGPPLPRFTESREEGPGLPTMVGLLMLVASTMASLALVMYHLIDSHEDRV